MKRFSSKISGSRVPVLLLTIALIFTGMVFGWFIWRIQQTKEIANLRQEILTNPEKAGDSIVYLKEILTIAARTSAAAGNLEYENEYKKFEPQLTQKIGEIKSVLPDTMELESIDQLEENHLELLGMEQKAFTLIRDERIEEARNLLSGKEYETQRIKFFARVPKVVTQLNELQKNELANEYQYSNRFIGAAIIVFGLSLIAWVTAIRNISNSHRKLLISTAEKERTQEALLKSEQYQNLFRLANDAILVIEPESEIVLDANEKACEMYGYKRNDFIGLSLKAITEATESNNGQMEELYAKGSSQEFESVQLRADGSPIHLLINSSLIEYRGGGAILSINRDITERKRADGALRESEHKMRTLLDNMSEGLIQINNNDIIEFVNDRFCEMLEYDRDELIGAYSLDILVNEYEKRHFAAIRNKNPYFASGQFELQLKKNPAVLSTQSSAALPFTTLKMRLSAEWAL